MLVVVNIFSCCSWNTCLVSSYDENHFWLFCQSREIGDWYLFIECVFHHSGSSQDFMPVLSGVCKDFIRLTHAVLYTVPLYCYCPFLSPQYRQGVQGGVPGACNSWHRGRGHRLLPRLGDVWALSPCGRASLGGGSRPQWHWAICSVPGEAQTVHLFRAFHFLRTFDFGPGFISRHSRIILIVSSGGNMEFFETCWCSYETQQAALLMSPGLDSVSNCCSVFIHYPLQIFASFPLSTYSFILFDSPSLLLTEYLQCWVLYSFIQGKEVSVLHLEILWMKIFLFPFFNFTIQGWLQGCTVMSHFLSWHFIVFLFEVKLWFFSLIFLLLARLHPSLFRLCALCDARCSFM